MKLTVAFENRIVRLGLLTASMVLAVWAWKMTLDGPVAQLRIVQAERAYTEAIMRAPKPMVPQLLREEDRLVSHNAAAAADQMIAELARIAGANGLLIERMAPESDAPEQSAAIRISVSGDEAAILRFVGAVEAGRPLVRFKSWRLKPAGTARALQFEGLAVAHWSPAE